MSLLPATPATRTLGSSGIAISPIAWSMWRLAEDGRSARDAARLVHAALDAGIMLDTAGISGFDGTSGFGDAETAGKNRTLGVSNMTTWQTAALNQFLGNKLAVTRVRRIKLLWATRKGEDCPPQLARRTSITDRW